MTTLFAYTNQPKATIPSSVPFMPLDVTQHKHGAGATIRANFSLPKNMRYRIIPCLSVHSMPHSYVCTARFKGSSRRLARIGSNTRESAEAATEVIDGDVDTLEIEGPGSVELSIDIEADPNTLMDASILLTISLDDGASAKFEPAQNNVPILTMSPRSQMEEAQSIRRRVCSPSSLGMMMSFLGKDIPSSELIAASHHDAADLYGVWAQNVWAATQHGFAGSILHFSNWSVVHDLLRAQIPIAASIRYQEGELTNAAIEKTDGHIIVLAGINENSVAVYDPAAPTAATVKRSYSRMELETCWLKRNAIGYIIFPPA